jgi:predicted AAA+ superfamily ATPase
MLYRKFTACLKDWYHQQNRKPLIIRGARQVGKSTTVRLFARDQSIPLYEVNLEKQAQLDPVFARLNIIEILKEIELTLGIKIERDGSGVLFLDEIQAAPNAITALRYFHEEMPHLPVIAAGSLLEFAMAKKKFSMPVGRVEYAFIGPMTFCEFLQALDENLLAGEMNGYVPPGPFSTTAHERLLSRFRDFLLIGGMPEAVAEFAATGSLARIPAIHQSIINTYRDDFGKYASGEGLARLERVFEYAAASAGEKIKYVNVNPHWKAADVRAAIDLLGRSGVVYPVHHSDGTGAPLGANADDTVFRLLFLDAGLMNAACGTPPFGLDAFKDNRFVNEGRMAEQVVGQHLLYANPVFQRPALYYWLREGKRGNAQVDFLIQSGSRIVPVEVKAGASGSLKSLHQFIAARSSPLAVRFDLNPPSIQEIEHSAVTPSGELKKIRFQLLSMPAYMAEQILGILSVL